MTSSEYGLLTRVVRELTGIVLDDTGVAFAENQLRGLLRQESCGTYSELLYKVRHDTSGALKDALIDRVTVQETGFFRDRAPFDALRDTILPELAARRSGRRRVPLRLWSAGCSTGQEAYSLAIVLRESLGTLEGDEPAVLGTDVSAAAIARASQGRYTAAEIAPGLSEERRNQYFVREDDEYRADAMLRRAVSFRRLNLHEDFSALGRWDVIFCRNVAAAFSPDDKRNLFLRLRDTLESDGVLVLGTTEPLLGLCPGFMAKRYGRSVFYSKA